VGGLGVGDEPAVGGDVFAGELDFGGGCFGGEAGGVGGVVEDGGDRGGEFEGVDEEGVRDDDCVGAAGGGVLGGSGGVKPVL